MKDHQIAKIHNQLRDTAVRYISASQLRARLASVVAPVFEENKKQKERIETLEVLIACYRADYSASFNEARRLRKVIQDNA